MKPLRTVEGVAAPLPRADVDTDQIIPKQFLKRVERSGYGAMLFNDWRYLEDGSPDPGFVLNRSPWDQARILVAGANFGCGSSREHAVWALSDFGIRAVIAPSFADIFRLNCIQSGMAPVQLTPDAVDRLMAQLQQPDRATLTVDVEGQRVTGAEGFSADFTLDPFHRRCLLEGLDPIDLTLADEELIEAHEKVVGPPSWD